MKHASGATALLFTSLLPPLLASVALSPVRAQQPDSSPKAKAQAGTARKAGAKQRRGGYLGLFISDGTRDGRGVVTIDSVFAGSDAERLGFLAGDEVVSVNGRAVANGDQFIMAVWMSDRRRGRRGKTADEIVVVRKGKEVAIQAGLKDLDAHPRVGDKAPSFHLKSPDGKTRHVLSELVGKKPLVLIFGSYT